MARANLVVDGGVTPGEVAAMRLRFSDTGTARWEAALSNDAGEPLGFGVDGGRISVFDRSVLDRAVSDSIAEAAGSDERSPASIVRVPARETAELFISDSGMGDGAYPAWWGIDSSGAVTELVVDFQILLRSTGSSSGPTIRGSTALRPCSSRCSPAPSRSALLETVGRGSGIRSC